MKINFASLALVFAFAAAGASTTAFANPTEKAEPAADDSAAVERKRPNRVPTTMTNYWDANLWDAEGAAAFWHATSDDRSVNSPTVRQEPAKKGSRLVKKLFHR